MGGSLSVSSSEGLGTTIFGKVSFGVQTAADLRQTVRLRRMGTLAGKRVLLSVACHPLEDFLIKVLPILSCRISALSIQVATLISFCLFVFRPLPSSLLLPDQLLEFWGVQCRCESDPEVMTSVLSAADLRKQLDGVLCPPCTCCQERGETTTPGAHLPA